MHAGEGGLGAAKGVSNFIKLKLFIRVKTRRSASWFLFFILAGGRGYTLSRERRTCHNNDD